jgi:hypothetical protein
MKKLVLPVIAVMIIYLVSCNQPASTSSAGESDKAKKNLDNSRAVTKMFESGDFSKIGDYIAPDAVDHWAMKGEVKGLDSLKALFEQYGSMMKDTKIDIVQEMANDDYSMLWIKQSGTCTMDDPMMHMKSGEHVAMESIEMTKHNADGKITDHWGFTSMKDMMKMMSGGGMDMNKMPMDTTSKSKMQKK